MTRIELVLAAGRESALIGWQVILLDRRLVPLQEADGLAVRTPGNGTIH